MKAFKVVKRAVLWAVIATAAALMTCAQLALGLPRTLVDESLKHGFAYSFQITEAFVNQYEANFYVLAQQMAARFEPFVDVVTGIVGQSRSAERVGKSDAYDIQSRHADTKYVETPHSSAGSTCRTRAGPTSSTSSTRSGCSPTRRGLHEDGDGGDEPGEGRRDLRRSRGSARTNTGTTALPAGAEDRGRRHGPHAREAPDDEGAARHERDEDDARATASVSPAPATPSTTRRAARVAARSSSRTFTGRPRSSRSTTTT
jgi:hypothetical protein